MDDHLIQHALAIYPERLQNAPTSDFSVLKPYILPGLDLRENVEHKPLNGDKNPAFGPNNLK